MVRSPPAIRGNSNDRKIAGRLADDEQQARFIGGIKAQRATHNHRADREQLKDVQGRVREAVKHGAAGPPARVAQALFERILKKARRR